MTEATAPSPSGVLGEIIRATKERVASRKTVTPLRSMVDRAGPSQRSLASALGKPGARFILEMKRRSPSRGDLRPEASVPQVAAAYRGLADAVSVLTEPEFFGGSLGDLAAMRDLVDAPILRKDFILEPWQVAESRLHGADAVLLMLSILDDASARDCLAMCRSLDMQALVEVHTADELGRALALGAEIIGINNRDLSTLEVDLATTEELAPRVPADRVLVTESGISSRHDVAQLAPQVDAFLVGTSLMLEPDLRGAAGHLTLGRFKVCGLTRVEDAEAAVEAGAWRLGTVFADDSLRSCAPDTARDIGERTGVDTVAVFRNQSIDEIVERTRLAHATTVQAHQELSSQDVEALRRRLPGVEIWQVHSVAAGSRPSRLPQPEGNRLFIDVAVDGVSGGTGRSFDFGAAASDPRWGEVIAAGGIRPESASPVLSTAPFAIDLSSSLEIALGVKSRRALTALHRALRPANRRGTETL